PGGRLPAGGAALRPPRARRGGRLEGRGDDDLVLGSPLVGEVAVLLRGEIGLGRVLPVTHHLPHAPSVDGGADAPLVLVDPGVQLRLRLGPVEGPRGVADVPVERDHHLVAQPSHQDLRWKIRWVTGDVDEVTVSTSKSASMPSRPSQRRSPRPRRIGTRTTWRWSTSPWARNCRTVVGPPP